jgi:hypothetical protein
MAGVAEIAKIQNSGFRIQESGRKIGLIRRDKKVLGSNRLPKRIEIAPAKPQISLES